jgi:hypothetical protein
VCRVRTCKTLLIPAFALGVAPPVLPLRLLRLTPTLPYHLARPSPERRDRAQIHRFGAPLSLDTLSMHAHSTSELLRTLSRMAASKPTSWLSARTHLLGH